MKKTITSIVLSLPILVHACSGYVIGFKGLDDVFDNNAFQDYSKNLNYCNKVYSWHQRESALKFVHKLNVKYQLYGYSKGAETVSYLLKHTKGKMPEYVITVGAYKTTDVNFDKYQIKYDNYFDNSGIGQRSPGIFIDVSHNQIQQEVNKLKK